MSSKKTKGLGGAFADDSQSIPVTDKPTKKDKQISQEPVRGRPVTGKSKSAGVKAGTHFKTSIILPIDLYQELSVEAAKDMQKDMSDIIADMLKARYKGKK